MSDKTRICSSCEEPKQDPDDFPKKGAQCKGCISKKAAASYRAKNRNGTKKKPKAKSAPKATAAKSLSLEIDACFGLEATVTVEGFLQVQQRNNEGDVSDTLVISRTEFRQLVDKFASWAST